ncbi:MAG: hypothetical protein ACM3SP_26030, partial [Chloroflexota bacterium]
MQAGTTVSRSATPIWHQVALRSFSRGHVKKLSWLVTFVAMLAMNLVQVHAAKQKTVRKSPTSKGKVHQPT